MTDTVNEYNQSAPKRPVFLMVLCILTFIGSGFSFCSSAVEYFAANKQVENSVVARSQINAATQQMDTTNDAGRLAARFVKSATKVYSADTLKKSALSRLLAAILCLIGALMMWRLKKTGFYVYILGTLIGLVIPYLLLGGGIIILVSLGITALIGIAFIIMYSLNLKDMR